MKEKSLNVEKPLEIQYAEFKDSLIKLINESGLPPFILSEVLNGMFSQTQSVAEEIYKELLHKQMHGNAEEEKCQDTISNKLD